MLMALLVGVGAMIGRRAYCVIEDTRHHCALFALIVGRTSRGRKGTAWDRAKRMLSLVDDDFMRANVLGGMASGEAVIHRLRDVDMSTGDPPPPPRYKQLLLRESEFGSVTQRAARPGSIISSTFRSAWDGDPLYNTTKLNGDRASDPHLCIVGMITAIELNATLAETEHHTGFVNRFLLCHSERTKTVPRSRPLVEAEVLPLVDQIRTALHRLTSVCVDLTPEAAELWDNHLYGPLTDGLPGKLDSIAARGAPMVRRVAMLYAVLDGEDMVRPAHLLAAVAVYCYSVDTAIYLWGARPLSGLAARALEAISNADDGLTAEALRLIIGKHTSSHDRRECLAELKDRGLITVSPGQNTGGRVPMIYRLAGGKVKRSKRVESAESLLGIDLTALSTLFTLPSNRRDNTPVRVVPADESPILAVV
jgi:hypothetical protein